MQHGRSYSVNIPSTDGKFVQKYPALAQVPFILDSRPAYHRTANAYLIDRALGLWSPDPLSGTTPGRILSPKTMLSYAEWLANFLEWAAVRSVDLLQCTYSIHLAGQYQTEMLQGLWSEDGKCLSPGTVNPRVQQACDFIHWLIRTNRRITAFEVPYTSARIKIGSANSAVGHIGREVLVRQGKARKETHALQMPTNVQVKNWLARIYNRYGTTIELICQTVLLTAMRREEVVCLRTDTLPLNPTDWVIANPIAPESEREVRITIQYGTKGPTYGLKHGDKIGPSREILIPLSLARKWHDYRQKERSFAFAKWMRGCKGEMARRARANDSVHLFLRDSDGVRFEGFELYDAWTGVELPLKGWSPHKGRHWWACSTLWREIKKYENIGQLSNETAAALIENSALSIIRLQIQPQLGHAGMETTMIYLRWVMDMLSRPLSLDEDTNTATDLSWQLGSSR
jgi:integrase